MLRCRTLLHKCPPNGKSFAVKPICVALGQQGDPTVRKYSTKEDEYLHESILPTMHFQDGLLRLPVPKLENSCKRYLASQRPMLNDEDYAKTSKLVEEFQVNDGQALQKELKAQDKQNKHTNYCSGPWFDMYLRDRRPVVLNHNPFIAFKDDPKPEYNEPVLRASNMIVAAMRYAKTFRASILEPEIYHLNPAKSDTDSFRKIARWIPSRFAAYYAIMNKAFPLDMSQFSRLLNSTRVPMIERDELYTKPTARHMLIMKNGNFYMFDTVDRDGNILPCAEIFAHVKYIYEDQTPPPEHPLGYLTAENRDTWATLRQRIVGTSEGNREALDLIDTASFCLCFDDVAPTEPVEMTKTFLHGDGANRWFDKSFSLLVAKNGLMAINFEHAWGDGVAVLRFFNETYKLTTEKPPISADSNPASIDSGSAVKLLKFDLDDTAKEGIKAAKKGFEERTSELSMNALIYDKFGKNLIKKSKLTPDGIMQLSFQMGYQKLTGGKVAATYESCSTAAFKHGRTETIRPATIQTLEASRAFSKGSEVSNNEKMSLLRACSEKHGTLTKEAAMGQGWDRHMFTLRSLAEKHGSKLGIFTDPAYADINRIILSTSSIWSPYVLSGGFGPVIPDGFGVGYFPEEENLLLGVTSYPSSPNPADFLECVRESWDQIHEVLSTSQE